MRLNECFRVEHLAEIVEQPPRVEFGTSNCSSALPSTPGRFMVPLRDVHPEARTIRVYDRAVGWLVLPRAN
jgi:hypothetical protein